MKVLFAVPLLALAGCASIGQGPTTLSGQWGGPGVDLVLEGGLGTVEFDCASGTIDKTVPSAEGPFSVPGTYRTGQAGPIRVGQIFNSQRATYSGTATKTDMTLLVKLEDGTPLGPFALKQGAPGTIDRCL
jgi:hypothetical protein